MKKLIGSLFLIMVLVFSFYSISMFTTVPPKAEALYANFWYLMELLCDECRGQWSSCCHQMCYETYVMGAETSDTAAMEAYQECMDTCPYNLASYCR